LEEEVYWRYRADDKGTGLMIKMKMAGRQIYSLIHDESLSYEIS